MIDYNKLKVISEIDLVKKDSCADITVIIPVRGRVDFIKPCLGHLLYAIDTLYSSNSTLGLKASKNLFDKNKPVIEIIVVEHSDSGEYKKEVSLINSELCVGKPYSVSYYNIASSGGVFNKCMAFNYGFLRSSGSGYYLFHDLDMLVKSDFFIKLLENLHYNDYPSMMQPFCRRRVLYMDKWLSDKIINTEIDIDSLDKNSDGITEGGKGAPGGSILVKNSLFRGVGGYDADNFHGYSVEDQFFWNKLAIMTNVTYADHAEIELFHMWHSNEHRKTPDEAFDYLYAFEDASEEDKLKTIDQKRKHFKQFIDKSIHIKFLDDMKVNFKSKLKLNIFDTAFSHLPCSCHDNDSKHISWVRSEHEVVSPNVAFYTDSSLDKVKSHGHKFRKNIAWLIEPPCVCPQSYEYVRQNKKDFDYVLSHQQWFLNEIGNVKGIYAPLGGCWIHKEDRQLYKKSKFMSIIASDKDFAPGHKLRHEVIAAMAKKYGIDVYGRGYDKLDYILPAYKDYAFQIVIENEKSDNWFTEKLINCFATGVVPIYYGSDRAFFNEMDLRWNTLEELEEIVSKLARFDFQREYLKFRNILADNFKEVEKYEVAEDYLFENYKFLFE